MKKVVFRYGLLSALCIVVLSFGAFFLVPQDNFKLGEIFGYLSMVVAMIFVFMGIKHYRDRVNGGTLTFGQGMKIGVLIVLIPAVFFGLFDILYTEVINPSWMEDYYTKYKEQLVASTPADKIEAELKKMETQKEMFGNPIFQFLLMSVTVFIIGLIATIISAIALRRVPKRTPATA